MRKQLAHLLILILISFAGFAQQKITGLIEDDESGTPISFATITSQKGEGIVSDSLGMFSIVIKKQVKPNDSILVTATGYSPKKIAVRWLVNNKTIQLSRKSEMLEQVRVYASIKGDYRKFGYYREWTTRNEGGEIGYIFDLTQNKVEIDRVQVKINHNYDTCWLKLHLRDAAVSGLALPENELLKEDFVLPVTIRYGLVEFDLNWLPVTIPARRLYAGFELLKCGCSESSAPSFFYMGNEDGQNFYRESETAIWKRGGDHTIYVRMILR